MTYDFASGGDDCNAGATGTEYRSPEYRERTNYALMKAQADMLASELAREKVRLSRLQRHIDEKHLECESLEQIVSFLMSEETDVDLNQLDLSGVKLMVIGGSPIYGLTLRYFTESMGGGLTFISKEMSAEALRSQTRSMREVDMVLFQSNTFSELGLWDIARQACEEFSTRFSILSRPTLSCFLKRVSAAFSV